MPDSSIREKYVKSYFTENAGSWILDAYETDGYNYPVGLHRVRVVLKAIEKLNSVQRILDAGCGGGHLSYALAERGFDVTGVDQSEAMIRKAKGNMKRLKGETSCKPRFELSSLKDLETTKLGLFDVVIAMGLVGYLPNDKMLFELGRTLIREKGYLIVSFRNRLFNLYSISHRTLRDVEERWFPELVKEASERYRPIDKDMIKSFIEALHKISGELLVQGDLVEEPSMQKVSPSIAKGKKYSFDIEARQTTPKQAEKLAETCDFNTLNLYGIHPHLTLPRLNELLPVQVFNRLSDALIPLEETPISLLWSSVFIGVFQKK